LFEKVILKIVQRHVEDKGLLNASQFGFRALHNTKLQCMGLTDHPTLNFNNKILRLPYSWISKKPLVQHGTLACYINNLIGIFDRFD
jgi:hypothetical protein